jgi:hypothetical protein
LIGDIAGKAIFGNSFSISDKHGEFLVSMDTPCFFYFAMKSPQWILKASTPEELRLRKAEIWEDLRELYIGIQSFEWDKNKK